jgi:hypothetical protein
MKADYLYDQYSAAGFIFTKDVISDYCLSLYTKPFVIISGISGTGKSKMAQLFQPFISDTASESGRSQANIASNTIQQYITLTVTDGIMNGDGRGNFRQEDLTLLLSVNEYNDYKREREELQEKGTTDNFKQLYWITLVDDNRGEYKIQFYVQRAQSPLIRVRFKSKHGTDQPYDLQPYLKRNYKVDDVIRLMKVDEKRFKIIKVIDEEVIKTEHSLKTRTFDNNICFIPVKSDWTDPSGIMGFYNIIEKSYHIGPLLKHLLYANENPDVPFFVILDEMNLSKIEYYLSDVLSVLETRLPGKDANQVISKEKIMLHSASSSDDYIDTDDEYFDTIPAKVSIPTNFYITGTINIDETTYMPSPKVLDRANVIEFNAVELDRYFNNVDTVDSSTFILTKVPDFSKPILPSQRLSASLPETVKNKIMNINKILKKYNIHFGYRIAGEISLYIFHAMEYIANSDIVLNKAIDFQIIQKILPRINGNQAKIEKAIIELFCLLTGEMIDVDDYDLSKIANYDVAMSSYPLTVCKIKSILTKLSVYGFASFIE